MLPRLFKEIADTLLHNPNQFASGGLLLMALGGIAAYLRAVPRQLYEWFLHLFSMTMVLNDDSRAYMWFKWWFQTHPRSRKIRHVDVITPCGPEKVEVLLSPAPGSHWFIYRGRPFRMTFTRSEEKGKMWSEKRPETMTLRVIGRDQEFLKQFVTDIREKYNEKNYSVPKLYFWSTANSGWDNMPFLPRPFDSVILPKGQREDIINDIKHFQENKSWYDSTGMPYHRSYMFYGPPGTGKTSTLLGIASYFKMNIYLFKLVHMSDEQLVGALHQVEQNSMIVFEDIDALENKRENVVEKKDKKKEEKKETKALLTLSGLLNAIDGIETPSGSMFFMTTNKIESLDAALLRKGRVDRQFYLGPASKEQKLEMFARFFPDTKPGIDIEFMKSHPKANTMAEFQEELKQRKKETD